MEIEVKTVHEYPLRKKMDEQGMSIRQLAEKSGVDYTYISRLLKGKSRASVVIADKIRTALGDSPDPKSL